MSGSQTRQVTRLCTIVACLLHQACQAGRGAYIVYSVADRCLLLYNGLTQGQGHTVRQITLILHIGGSSPLESNSICRAMECAKLSQVLCFIVTLFVIDVRTELCDRLYLDGLDEDAVHFPQFGSKFSVDFTNERYLKIYFQNTFKSTFDLCTFSF